jgi:hypothetical protein
VEYIAREKERVQRRQIKNDLQDALKKLRTMRASGGDTFFVGLARLFTTRPEVPNSWREEANLYFD